MQLSIIIVNYNVKYFLEQCLCSVIKATKNITAEIFIVDNNSTDGSKEFFTGRFTEVKFIWIKENVGFAKANNEALRFATGEKVLFLNPDTIVPEDCFEKCLNFFSSTENIGALGVKMIDGSGSYLPESKRGFPTAFISFCKISGLTKLFPHSKLLARYYLGHLAENETSEVDVLPGAFMMVDWKTLDITGSFDEDFFMYGEDIDLSYRIQNAGFKNYYFPGTTIIHFKGESTQKQSKQYLQNFYGAMMLFTKKHFGKFGSYIYQLMIRFVIAVKSSNIETVKEKTTVSNKMYGGNAIIFCDASSYQDLKKLLQKYFGSIEYADNISQIKPETKILIFCEPFFSIDKIIHCMEINQNKYQFFIHTEGTGSIVGSADKKEPGLIIAIN